MAKRKNRLAQKILHFYCPTCREYHLKTHAHYRAMKLRAKARRIPKIQPTPIPAQNERPAITKMS
jgi:hypothetical protein